jgi:carbonic anhydrase/acetyltransferase-like protein (isoleucine patch superfamily)
MNIQERLTRYLGKKPDVSRAMFIAPNATVVGDVTLGKDSSVWYGAVLRADIESIIIGDRTNIQDGVIVHLSNDFGTQVGDDCVIGHAAILHACKIGNGCLIGMRATVLDGTEIGEECLIGAHALVPQGFKAPARSLLIGAPAQIKRELKPDEIEYQRDLAAKYVEVARAHVTLNSKGDL